MLAAAVVAIATVPAGAAGGADAITVERPWVRPSIGRAPNSAAYMTLRNPGEADDELISAATPVATNTELHRGMMESGVMRMEPVAALKIPAGSEVVLEPGGLHIMLLGLKRRIETGETVPLSLTFRRAGTVTVEATATMSAESGHSHSHMPKKGLGGVAP